MNKATWIQKQVLMDLATTKKEVRESDVRVMIEHAETTWDVLTEAGYGEDPIVLRVQRKGAEDMKMSNPYDVAEWKDDCKHLNMSISHWESCQAEHINACRGVSKEDLVEGSAALYARTMAGLDSARSFKANDPTGYAEMHGLDISGVAVLVSEMLTDKEDTMVSEMFKELTKVEQDALVDYTDRMLVLNSELAKHLAKDNTTESGTKSQDGV